MTVARRKLISLDVTSWYHCTSRCVRRAYLCGRDKLTKRNLDHRKAWIEELLLELTTVFCIEVAAYAVMSNHYHVVIKVDQNRADSLTDQQVVERLLKIYKGSDLIKRMALGDSFSSSEQKQLTKDLQNWRQLLTDVGRFFGYINQTVARRANKEDDCTGRFWEGRFSSQAILDDASLIRVLCYVDLNPIRAKQTQTATQSPYTSIKQRTNSSDSCLVPFSKSNKTGSESTGEITVELPNTNYIPMTFEGYCQLLDWTARKIKLGGDLSKISDPPASVEVFGFSEEQWMAAMQKNLRWRQKALGSIDRIREYATAVGQKWIWAKQ